MNGLQTSVIDPLLQNAKITCRYFITPFNKLMMEILCSNVLSLGVKECQSLSSYLQLRKYSMRETNKPKSFSNITIGNVDAIWDITKCLVNFATTPKQYCCNKSCDRQSVTYKPSKYQAEGIHRHELKRITKPRITLFGYRKNKIFNSLLAR